MEKIVKEKLEKLKKEELITIILEQYHLAEAVDAKDLEIAKLTERLDNKVASVATNVPLDKYNKLLDEYKLIDSENKRVIEGFNEASELTDNLIMIIESSIRNTKAARALHLEHLSKGGKENK